MRRVIQGRTYDTAKSKLVATDAYEADNDDNDGTNDVLEELYLTAGGAFFVVTYITEKGESEPKSIRFAPYTREEADRWWKSAMQAELFDETVFALPDEAAAEDAEEKTVTFTFRLPETLRGRLQKAAAEQSVSINTFLIRCAQSCIKP